MIKCGSVLSGRLLVLTQVMQSNDTAHVDPSSMSLFLHVNNHTEKERERGLAVTSERFQVIHQLAVAQSRDAEVLLRAPRQAAGERR